MILTFPFDRRFEETLVSAQMIVGSSKLVTPAELRRLRCGSYEALIEEIEKKVRAFLGDTPFEVIATRESEVLVCTEDGFRLISMSADPEERIQSVDVEVFDASNRRAFVEREAGAIARLFTQGALKEAVTRLETLVPLIPASRGFPRAVLHIEALDRSPRIWRRIFDARRAFIEAFLSEDLISLTERRLRPRFEWLYDGSIAESKLTDYAGDVTEVLGEVLGRLGQVKVQAHQAYQSIAAASRMSEEDELLGICQAFAEDLVCDLSRLCEAGSRALVSVTEIQARGRLCDVLIEALNDREVASRFVVVVATKMGEAN